uniref:Uncharacterized protein n=1 Tax=Arundo donax TaxID=35708 RepID=A0A0A9FZS1_ARUDO
MCIEIGKQK